MHANIHAQCAPMYTCVCEYELVWPRSELPHGRCSAWMDYEFLSGKCVNVMKARRAANVCASYLFKQEYVFVCVVVEYLKQFI